MKKTLLSLMAVIGITMSGYTQTVTNLPPISGNTNFWTGLWGTLTTGSNWLIAPHYIYGIDHHRSGAGLALVAKLSESVATAVGFDYLGPDGMWMPQASLQLNAPVLTLGKVKTVFFGYTGISTPLSSGEQNWTAVAIAGAGANFRIYKKLSVFGAWEYRSSDFGQFIRAGADIAF